MPIFDFVCNKCEHKFDLMISNADKEKVKCPECGTTDIKQLLSLFSTSRGGTPTPSNSCQGCSAAGQGS